MKNLLLSILAVTIVATTLLWVRYGGGGPYPDLTTTPELAELSLQEVLSYSEPIGNVAVNRDGRVFFTVHSESRPQGNKLLEYVSEAAVPYPSGAAQSELFDSVLGITIDQLNRLWTIDHGNHGLRTARLIAIDLDTGEIHRNQTFDRSLAPIGSFLQDLQVSADGQTVVIADTSVWRKKPALIVYDVETGQARRVLESEKSVAAEPYVIRTENREMKFLGGIVAMRGGVDGIALGPKWLYFGSLTGSGLYRIRLDDLRDFSLPSEQLANRVERFSDKPLSDGLSTDIDGNVYVTDVEHSAIFVAHPDQTLTTLIQSESIRWPDALSFGPDGYLYIADSALPDVILKSREHIESSGPYQIFRFKPGHDGIPGQ
ncbi:MAG: SMP-30/gluconolactonase/LRE family protein [Woeseiaceae bacterium]